MKLNHTIGIAISATLLLSACAEIQETQQQPQQPEQELKDNEIVFIAQEEKVEANSKTTFGEAYKYIWEDTDKTGLFIQSTTPTANAEAALSRSADGKAVFTATTAAAYEATDLIHAYYPYSAEAGNNPAAVKLVVPSRQTQSGSSINGAFNPMVSVPATAGDGKTAQVLKFRQLAAMLEMTVVSDGAALANEKVLSVTLTEDSKKNICGDFTYDLTKVTAYEAMPAIEVTAGNMSITVNNQNGADVLYASLIPGTYGLLITVTTDKATYLFPARSQAVEFPRGYLRRITLDLAKATKNTALYDQLTSQPWVVSLYGCGGADWESTAEPVPDYTQDDKMLFLQGGRMALDLGSTQKIYNDDGIMETAPDISGNERWQLIEKEGQTPVLRLTHGGHLAMIPDNAGIDGGDYNIVAIDDNQIRLEYNQAKKGQNFILMLTKYQENVNDYLFDRSWKVVKLGYDYGSHNFDKVAPVSKDERITFKQNGQLKIVTDNWIYNDAIGNFEWTPTGKESYKVQTQDGKMMVQMENGGYPGVMFKNPGTDFLYEVRELSATTMSLYWSLGDGGYVGIDLVPGTDVNLYL